MRQAGPGQVLLAFHSQDPSLELNPRGKFAVQLFSDEELGVEPVVTGSMWPKGKASLVLRFRPQSKPKQIDAEATYMVCHKGTRNCQQQGSAFSTVVK